MKHYSELKAQVEVLNIDIAKFEMGNHVAGTRLRKQLANIKRTCQSMRNEVQDIRRERKNSKH